jgi:hypothetical protein
MEELERLTNEFEAETPIKSKRTNSSEKTRSISEEDLPGADFREGHYIG